MKRILVVQTGFIGDVVLSTSVFANLRNRYPSTEIIALTTPLAKGLLEYHPAIAKVLVFDKRGGRSGFRGLLQMAAELRQFKFEAVFSLHKSWRTALLLRLANIPVRYGFKEASGAFLYTRTAPRRELSHEVLRNLAILRCIGLEPIAADKTLVVSFSPAAQNEARTHLQSCQGKRVIGFAPGSVWPTKRWPSASFIELGKQLIEEDFDIVLVGGPDDRALGSQIQQALGERCIDLTGKTSLPVSAAVIAELDVLVSNDSAPLHLASAVKTPSVALFCATIPEFGFGPWENEHRILGVAGLACRPCGRHGAKTCPTGTRACMLELNPVAVRNAIHSLLADAVRPQVF